MSEIKSPLRYPGGKSRAISQITEHLPTNFTEYWEPFVGGGSLFIHLFIMNYHKAEYPENIKSYCNRSYSAQSLSLF